MPTAVLKTKKYVYPLVIAALCVGFVYATTAFAQVAKSPCVVTKVGEPGTEPTLPADCDGGGSFTGELQFPAGMEGPSAEGYYKLPSSKNPVEGYFSINCEEHQWGSKKLVGVIYTVAKMWQAKYPQGYLRLGDLNASGHKTHNKGAAVDVYATSNGSDCVAGYINNSAMDGKNCAVNYNREATVELGKMFLDTKEIKQILYLDTSVNAELSKYAKEKGLNARFLEVDRHDDHFHVDVILEPPLQEWFPKAC